MSAEGPYPKSDLYRANKNKIEKIAWDQKYKEFCLRLYGETKGMFGNTFDVSILTQEEQDDVKNFARYALKRLVAHSLVYRSHHEPAPKESENAPERLRIWEGVGIENSSRGIGHDLMHASIAYVRTHGKSLAPEYNATVEVESREEREERRQAEILEEIYVNIFAYHERVRAFLEQFPANDSKSIEKKLAEHGASFFEKQRLKKLLQVNPSMFAMQIWERYGGFTLLRPELERFLEKNRSQSMVAYMGHLYSDINAGKAPDPKFAFKEWQQMMTPLLARLRYEADA